MITTLQTTLNELTACSVIHLYGNHSYKAIGIRDMRKRNIGKYFMEKIKEIIQEKFGNFHENVGYRAGGGGVTALYTLRQIFD